MRAAWEALGLSMIPRRPEITARTLSAVVYPEGVGPELVGRIASRGVVVAAGLHPKIRDRYFRVGHMGFATVRTEMLLQTVDAVAGALNEGPSKVDGDAARERAEAILGHSVSSD